MYFGNNGLRKTWLGNCLESLFEIWKTAPLPYLLITLHAIGSKRVSLIDLKKLILVVNIFTADENYSLLNRDNLTQPIHMQLYQKQNFFLEFFLHF